VELSVSALKRGSLRRGSNIGPFAINAQTAVSALSSIRSLALADNQRNGGRLLF
jgi:hypothetical protein